MNNNIDDHKVNDNNVPVKKSQPFKGITPFNKSINPKPVENSKINPIPAEHKPIASRPVEETKELLNTPVKVQLPIQEVVKLPKDEKGQNKEEEDKEEMEVEVGA